MKIRWELYERLKIFSLELYPVWFYLVGCGMVLVGNYWPGIIPLTTDIGQLLKSLGFDSDYDYSTGIIKYVHPDLEIQFVTPERGRGRDTAYNIKQLQIKAEGIRYLGILQDNSFTMKHEDISLRIPEPEAYVLQKILASRKRANEDKRAKDLDTAFSIGELCMQDHKRRRRMKAIFNDLPKKWQKEILKTLRDSSPDMYSPLIVK